ncbi:MAG: hypothetical protein CVU24_17990 [Betaproteobacteria bacterium HGW-Betaproteobacteria-18]|jgi:hypothetical protein|nr:MAG: hypothetical protein CVU73_11090 [Deltaproteobacteria bacterium HGW-Deltaproteobacteria-8]PKO57986.1 MAG: hypothetical protein CVU24_17990 [Betaproteobacteria bacterium HGW-Betaproteobacteria-18]
MPVNGFTVGRDVTLTIITSSGPLNLSLITSFKSKQDTSEQKVKGLDGITRHARFYDGWSGSFSLDRMNSNVDDYFAQLEDNYFMGINELPCTITETIQEVDGSVSQYRYTNVLLKLDDAGDYSGDKTVKQSISFVASRRQQTA